MLKSNNSTNCANDLTMQGPYIEHGLVAFFLNFHNWMDCLKWYPQHLICDMFAYVELSAGIMTQTDYFDFCVMMIASLYQ